MDRIKQHLSQCFRPQHIYWWSYILQYFYSCLLILDGSPFCICATGITVGIIILMLTIILKFRNNPIFHNYQYHKKRRVELFRGTIISIYEHDWCLPHKKGQKGSYYNINININSTVWSVATSSARHRPSGRFFLCKSPCQVPIKRMGRVYESRVKPWISTIYFILKERWGAGRGGVYHMKWGNTVNLLYEYCFQQVLL